MPRKHTGGNQQFNQRGSKQKAANLFFINKQRKVQQCNNKPFAQSKPKIQFFPNPEVYYQDQKDQKHRIMTASSIDPRLEYMIRLCLTMRIPVLGVAAMTFYMLATSVNGEQTDNQDATYTGSSLSSFTWPGLPSFTWPGLPSFTWPSLPSFTWPSLIYKNNNIRFAPVNEVFVDQLPESISDLEYIHSTSKLPVVFRGASKHWKAMNWTPETLKEKISLEPRSNSRLSREETIRFSNVDERASLYEEKISLFNDLQYHEKNVYKDITKRERDLLRSNTDFNNIEKRSRYEPESIELYTNFIFTGIQGSGQEWHAHSSVLLTEFYGYKIVFLAEPCTEEKIFNQLENESNKIIKNLHNQEKESLLGINSQSRVYFPFQQLILKPGDTLHIPQGWYHKVHYFSQSIGSIQRTNICELKKTICNPEPFFKF